MIQKKTLEKYFSILKQLHKEGKKITADSRLKDFASVLRKEPDSPEKNEFFELYNSMRSKNPTNKESNNNKNVEVDTDDVSSITYTRDSNNRIISYNYTIYIKNKTPLVGSISREEMETIYRLYSYYGLGLTQRQVSRHFYDLSLIDFKRILRAFNITKASAPFPPHSIEEKTEEELLAIQLRDKENNLMLKIEKDKLKDTEYLLNKTIQEKVNLENELNKLKTHEFKIDNFPKIKFKEVVKSKTHYDFINVYLADMHIGAKTTFSPLYDDNINWGMLECQRRLQETIKGIKSLGTFDKINICLMGDMMDSCGPINKTARLDHSLPENMDGFEQANAYISLITNFVFLLADNNISSSIELFSVQCGNHTGPIEYVATKAIFAELRSQGIPCTLFDSYFGTFNTSEDRVFVLHHGKDSVYHKKNFPLNLDDNTRVKMYEWFMDNNIYEKNIHVIKGDLHSTNYNSCHKFDWRNVISIYGASDHSAFNYSRNSYGVSYDLCINGNLVRGEFLNM